MLPLSPLQRLLLRNMPFSPANSGTNMHVLLVGKEHVELQQRPLPVIGETEVLIQVMATGVCGTDVSFYTRGGIGARVVSAPIVLGHEGAGIVHAVGSGVTNVQIGDHVAIEPALPCRTCRFCRSGQWNYCEKDQYFATPSTGKSDLRKMPNCSRMSHYKLKSATPLAAASGRSWSCTLTADGTLCQYYACPAINCVPLPTSLPWPLAGCIQPLAIAVQIARRAGKLSHATVGVLGCGPLGLLCMAVMRAYGAREVVGFDRSSQRVQFAKEYAATHAAIVPMEPSHGEAPHKSTKTREAGDPMLWLEDWAFNHFPEWHVDVTGFDVVIDVTGAEACMQLGVALLRPGGTREPFICQLGLTAVVLAGMGPPIAKFPTLEVAAKELNVLGSLRYTTRCFEDGIHLVERGLVKLGPLVTKTFPLSKAEEAFKASRDGQEIKVVVMNQE